MLGTERDSFALSLLPASEDLRRTLEQCVADEIPAEKKVLRLAAVLACYEHVGRDSAEAKAVHLPELCPKENQAVCPASASNFLIRILEEDVALLKEWLSLALPKQWIAPHALLVRLLEEGVLDTSIRSDLAQLVGHRGMWLAQHNPNWAYLLDERQGMPVDSKTKLDDSDWQHGRIADRMNYLRRLRCLDPDKGREALGDVWDEETAKVRSRLLSVLEAGLGPRDETFLEKRLDDRSKQVRACAANLLSILPGSQWSERMSVRAARAIQIDRRFRKVEIHVTLPETLDQGMKRDGLGGKSRDHHIGERASLLAQIISRTPLSFWTDERKTAYPKLIKSILDHEWEASLIIGLSQAAYREVNADLALAILSGGVDEKWYDGSQLVALLPDDQRISYLIQKTRRLPDDDVKKLLIELDTLTQPGPWDESLSEAAWSRYIRLLRGASNRYDWHLSRFLSIASLRFPLAFAPQALSSKVLSKNPPARLSEEIDRFSLRLEIRNRMQKEMTS